jgi:transaldolase
VTSNPAIFEKALTGSSDYRAILERPRSECSMRRRFTSN